MLHGVLGAQMSTLITMPDRLLPKATCSPGLYVLPVLAGGGQVPAHGLNGPQGQHVPHQVIGVVDVGLRGVEEGVKTLVSGKLGGDGEHKSGSTMERTGKVFNEIKMKQIYISFPLFSLSKEECKSSFERWIYTLKNMNLFEQSPFKEEQETFLRLLDVANVNSLSEKERAIYEENLKNYRDWYATIDYAQTEGIEKGMQKGIEKGRQEENSR